MGGRTDGWMEERCEKVKKKGQINMQRASKHQSIKAHKVGRAKTIAVAKGIERESSKKKRRALKGQKAKARVREALPTHASCAAREALTGQLECEKKERVLEALHSRTV